VQLGSGALHRDQLTAAAFYPRRPGWMASGPLA
jgi:hypothetical protein